MSLLEFLEKLCNTLERIEIHGRQNIEYMKGCFDAIENAKQALLDVQKAGGEKDGRQTDIGTDGSD